MAEDSVTGPVTGGGDGLRIAVRVVPKASGDAVAGLRVDGRGCAALLVRVTAVPEKGKANAAVRRLLARALKVAPGSLDLLSGETDRNKIWRLDPAAGLTAPEVARRLGLADAEAP
ncbi:DUF167 domain-containing protein [Marinibaculum pumilum]|uniref:UPF0235 protein ACFOGJ_13140 n=1 Tax=Marinibaculum pumilum TaxID=1766165 RepID=A0ABV7L0V3_9PROT